MRITLITIIALFFLAPIARADTVYNGLVGYWPLDARDYTTSTTVLDRSGNGNTGTLYPNTANQFTSTSTVLGKIGQALKFNGTTQYALANDSISLRNLGPLTYSMWIYPYTLAPANQLLYGKSTKLWYLSSNILEFYLSTTGTAAYWYCNTPIVPNKWQLVTTTWNGIIGAGLAANIYINGKACIPANFTIGNVGTGSAASDTGVNLGIGARNTGLTTFGGYLDDARVYNRALSGQEVNQLYREEGGSYQNSFMETITSIISNLI